MAKVDVPLTLAQALDPQWLSQALAPVSGGKPVTQVETVEVIRTFATKARFVATCEGAPNGKFELCLKGALDYDPPRGGRTMVQEADFYASVAPEISVQTPELLLSVVDRETANAVVIMQDLIVQGGTFNTALRPFTLDEAAATLEQLARLHVRRDLLTDRPWIRRRVDEMAKGDMVPPPLMEKLMAGPRGIGLPDRTKDAVLTLKALQAVAERDGGRPAYLVHGDCHAGNSFRTDKGAGLIDWQLLQSGGWALDLPYHIGAVLTVEMAEREERNLLAHYLEVSRSLGGEPPGMDEAWLQYRECVAYGYYLWAMTQWVDPAITETFVNRLGNSVTRHDTYKLLGVV